MDTAPAELPVIDQTEMDGFRWTLYLRKPAPPNGYTITLSLLSTNPRKRHFRLQWNGHRLVKSKDNMLLSEHHPAVHAWLVSVLESYHHVTEEEQFLRRSTLASENYRKSHPAPAAGMAPHLQGAYATCQAAPEPPTVRYITVLPKARLEELRYRIGSPEDEGEEMPELEHPIPTKDYEHQLQFTQDYLMTTLDGDPMVLLFHAPIGPPQDEEDVPDEVRVLAYPVPRATENLLTGELILPLRVVSYPVTYGELQPRNRARRLLWNITKGNFEAGPGLDHMVQEVGRECMGNVTAWCRKHLALENYRRTIMIAVMMS